MNATLRGVKTASDDLSNGLPLFNEHILCVWYLFFVSTARFWNFFHRLEFKEKNTTFQKLNLSPSSANRAAGTFVDDSTGVVIRNSLFCQTKPSKCLRMGTGPVSESRIIF